MNDLMKKVKSYTFILIFSLLAFSIGLIGTYNINRTILANNLGDGYIIGDDPAGENEGKDPLQLGPTDKEAFKIMKEYIPPILLGIITLLIVIVIIQKVKIKKINAPKIIEVNTKDEVLDEDLTRIIPNYNKKELIKDLYKTYVFIKTDYQNKDFNKLKFLLSASLFNDYKRNIILEERNNEKVFLKDITYRGSKIKEVKEEDNKIYLTLELKTSYFNYKLRGNDIVKGYQDKKIISYDELTFIANLNDYISVCTHCGAKSNITSEHVCEYCNQTVEKTKLRWILDREKEIIKSYNENL